MKGGKIFLARSADFFRYRLELLNIEYNLDDL